MEQIRYIRSLHAHAELNFLQIRELLQKGDRISFGLLLPQDADKIGVRLQELGFSYNLRKEKVYRQVR